MIKLVYITSSSFSGSTLLSFLLNTHPDIFTVGEMDGWNYGENENFLCSCGNALEACPLFKRIHQAFSKNNLPFNYKNFGTSFCLSSDDRLNRILCQEIPFIFSNSRIEKCRDKIISMIPYFTRRLNQIFSANDLFIRESLKYSGASAFVDACKDPYRLRFLKKIPHIDLRVVYLIRDYRGFVLSNKRNKGIDVETSIRIWIHQQNNILRILRDFKPFITLYYEDVINKTNETLSSIYSFVDLNKYKFEGDFRAAEHHILGNDMRLKSSGRIIKKISWKKDLSVLELKKINSVVDKYLINNPHNQLSSLLSNYLNNR